MDTELNELLRRGVTALEKLADDPEIQVPAFPAVCPHCEVMNPEIRVQEQESQGRLAEFMIEAHCTHCNNVFYALPMQFICVKDMEQARGVAEERKEQHGYQD